MKTGDYINGLVQDIISNLAPKEMRDKAKHWLTLFIFQREGDEWIPLSDELNDINERVLAWVNKRDNEEWGTPKECGTGVAYGEVQKNVADHRLGSDGKRKSLLWLLYMDEKNESLNILASVILKTLAPKYDNMLILEDMKSLYEDQSGREVIKKNYFFGDICDKEKLLNKYIEQVEKSDNLPEFRLLCHLSSMRYETRQNKTTLYFSRTKQRTGLKFNSPGLMFGEVEHLRTIRKIMEISGDEGAVCIKQPEMIITGVVPIKAFEGLTVEFKGNAEWILRKKQQEILIYRRGEYLIPAFASKQEQELEKLEQLRENCPNGGLENIKRIIDRFKNNSPHGTSIVFMESEALRKEIEDRFSPNGYTIKVKEFPLKGNGRNDNMLRGVASIDGAILSDLDGRCQAIGTILDGKFVGPGDQGRGARYNSVRNYVQWYKNHNPDTVCFAVIISEDGMINVEIPEVE